LEILGGQIAAGYGLLVTRQEVRSRLQYLRDNRPVEVADQPLGRGGLSQRRAMRPVGGQRSERPGDQGAGGDDQDDQQSQPQALADTAG
jgi:hypothetical protein